MENDGSLGCEVLAWLHGDDPRRCDRRSVALHHLRRRWYAWGFFGVLAFITVAGLVFGWAFDRREKKRRAECGRD
jgi:hypothetical protein